jgi:hypothetical protein
MSTKINKNIDEALLNFYKEVEKDYIKNELNENIDAYNLKKNQITKQILFIAKATANKKKQEHLFKLVDKFQEALEKNIEKPVAMLKQLIQSQSKFVFNRNLDKLTREEIIEIIKDKNLIELLEQLDKKENN